MKLLRSLVEAARDRWFGLAGDTRGIILITCDNLSMSVLLAVIKTMGTQYHAIQLVFMRSIVGLILLAPVLFSFRLEALRTQRLPLHVVRVIFSVTTIFCLFLAVSTLPLAEATALAFTRPLIMTLFAVLFLGEIVRWRRWTAVAAGFIGVLVMVRPDRGEIDPMMLVAIASSISACAATVVVKKLTATETTPALMCYSAFGMLALTAIPGTLVWEPVRSADLVPIVSLGVLSIVGQFFFLRAYVDGRAAVLAPFDYSRLLFATALGFLVFGELPGIWTVLGAIIIAASTLYITYREAALSRPKPPPPDARV